MTESTYSTKIVTAEEAIKCIKNGDLIVFSHAAAIPQIVSKALTDNKENYRDVKIFHMLNYGETGYLQEGMEDHFKLVTPFASPTTRNVISEKRADYIPCFFHEVPALFKKNYLQVDVAVVQLSRPDENGYCSYGLSCDYTKPVTELAPIIIAEINDQMPYVKGDNMIHVSKLDYIIECSYPVPEVPQPAVGELEQTIAQYCKELIQDGSTLQLGIGAIPDAVLKLLKDKNDLGIHSELISDGVRELYEAGVITGKRKTLHKDKIVATFLMGTQKFYDFANNNNDLELYPVDYVNDPCVIMKNDNLIGINSCIEMDLMGQVVSECIGIKQFSGTGGQVDFLRGASASKGGKAIIAMPSTASKGTRSRIVPFLAQGAAVTTSRNDVDYIITEYGIAHLKGKTLKQRAESLIEIAHPNFRDELKDEFKRRF
jgi:Acetyl-CoA hydrolase